MALTKLNKAYNSYLFSVDWRSYFNKGIDPMQLIEMLAHAAKCRGWQGAATTSVGHCTLFLDRAFYE